MPESPMKPDMEVAEMMDAMLVAKELRKAAGTPDEIDMRVEVMHRRSLGIVEADVVALKPDRELKVVPAEPSQEAA